MLYRHYTKDGRSMLRRLIAADRHASAPICRHQRRPRAAAHRSTEIGRLSCEGCRRCRLMLASSATGLRFLAMPRNTAEAEEQPLPRAATMRCYIGRRLRLLALQITRDALDAHDDKMMRLLPPMPRRDASMSMPARGACHYFAWRYFRKRIRDC